MLKGADAVTCWMGEPVAEVEQMECKGLVDRDYQWRAIWCSNYIYIMSFFSSAMFLSDFFLSEGASFVLDNDVKSTPNRTPIPIHNSELLASSQVVWLHVR